MKRRIKRYRLKSTLRNTLKRNLGRSLLTLVFIVVDILLYHYLVILGSHVGETSWVNTFILVGWFWLLAGQFIALYFMWED